MKRPRQTKIFVYMMIGYKTRYLQANETIIKSQGSKDLWVMHKLGTFICLGCLLVC